MRLLFLSSTRGNNNRELKSLVGDWYKKGKIGYIPSFPDPFGVYFQETKDWFLKQDPKGELRYLDIFDKSVKWWAERLKEFSGFIISGGNPFTLLLGLKRSGMGDSLVQIARETNKPILGIDEGGVVLTPEIGTHNDEGLHVVDFGFYPHYKKIDSGKVGRLIDKGHIPDVYVVEDASGLGVEGNKIIPIGTVIHLFRDHHAPEMLTPAEARG